MSVRTRPSLLDAPPNQVEAQNCGGNKKQNITDSVMKRVSENLFSPQKKKRDFGFVEKRMAHSPFPLVSGSDMSQKSYMNEIMCVKQVL